MASDYPIWLEKARKELRDGVSNLKDIIENKGKKEAA